MKFNLKNRPTPPTVDDVELWFRGFEKELRDILTKRDNMDMNKTNFIRVEWDLATEILGASE